MFCYELACLKAAKQFIRITANIARIYFVYNDFSLWIYDEASSLGHSIGLNQYPKVLT